jgi:polysaccharide biosynthesis transport protein
MNPKQPQPVAPSGQFSLADVYHILFKRKWLITVCALSGFIAAGAAFYMWHPSYQSTEKIIVSYIIDSKPLVTGDGMLIKSTGETSILASEIQILKSFDSAKMAANVVGPAKILAPYSGGTNEEAAAYQIMAGLSAEAVSGQIMSVTFTHRDFSLVQQVLQLMITNYQMKELEIHGKSGQLEADLRRERDMDASQLAEVRGKLAEAKNAVRVIDPETALTQAQVEEGILRRKIYEDQNALAGEMIRLGHLKDEIPTNAAAAGTNAGPLSPKAIAAYTKAKARLYSLQADKDKYDERGLSSENSTVKTNLAEIGIAQNAVDEMEKENPALLAVVSDSTGKATGPDPRLAYEAELVNVEVLQTNIINQEEEMQRVYSRGTNLVQLDSTVKQLEGQVGSLTADLARTQANLDGLAAQAGSTGRAGVTPIDSPTPPTRDLQKAPKVIAEIAAGGLGLGLALAVLLELVLDRSFKRPQEVVHRLKLPFFLAIPYMNGKMKLRLPAGGKNVKLLKPASEESEAAPEEQKSGALMPAFDGMIPPWDEKHALRPFHETLRDRLVSYFEEIGLTHKPKLVAVTGCDEGAGVSTIASGLASSLSETGEGNVLLVSMNSGDGEAHHFYKGRLTLGIDEVLHHESRGEAKVQDNLYVVKESSNAKLPSFLPKRFGHLVDKIKASDYDYIIFDMPPVTQISVTPRLARFMDTVLLVVEAEKTHHDAAQRAAALLVQSRANVGVVMNKTRTYVPKRLLQEL